MHSAKLPAPCSNSTDPPSGVKDRPRSESLVSHRQYMRGNRPQTLLLSVIVVLGILNGWVGLAQAYVYRNSHNRSQKVVVVLLNVTVFVFSLIYLPLRRQWLRSQKNTCSSRGRSPLL